MTEHNDARTSYSNDNSQFEKLCLIEELNVERESNAALRAENTKLQIEVERLSAEYFDECRAAEAEVKRTKDRTQIHALIGFMLAIIYYTLRVDVFPKVSAFIGCGYFEILGKLIVGIFTSFFPALGCCALGGLLMTVFDYFDKRDSFDRPIAAKAMSVLALIFVVLLIAAAVIAIRVA
jgi:hypothetical protein